MKDQQAGPDTARASALAAELRIVVSALTRRLREQGTADDLTSAQKSVLLRLERDGPATVTALARSEAMRPQSMGAIVSALQAAGLVEGAHDPADGRQTILSLTDRFRQWVWASRAARQDWLFRTIGTKLTTAEQERLGATLALLQRLIDP